MSIRNILFSLNEVEEYTPVGMLVDLFERMEKEGLVEVVDTSYDMGNTYKITDMGLEFIKNNEK